VTVGEARATRTLALLILLGIANHRSRGSPSCVDALSMGLRRSPSALMSLYALLPMLLVAAGRVSD
jgi:hypothetical protein